MPRSCNSFRSLSELAVLFAVSWAAGCGGGDKIERMPLSGTVTIDGQPVVYGTLDFVPDTGKSHSGPQGSAVIENGKYTTEKGGAGVVKGPHLVHITALAEAPNREPIVDETQAANVKPPETLLLNYPMEIDIQSETVDINVPKEALNANKSSVRRVPEP